MLDAPEIRVPLLLAELREDPWVHLCREAAHPRISAAPEPRREEP